MNLIEQMQREEEDQMRHYELDESPPTTPRFDEVPIQLETRGTTEQKPRGTDRSNLKPKQGYLWAGQTIHKNTIAAKLREAGRLDPAMSLEKCHTQFTVGVCNSCRKQQKFPNRCDRFYCPECQPRLANDRQRAVEWWTRLVNQPKHVVLTVQNLPTITKAHLLEFKKWFKNLRRSKFARNWQGGFYSIEITNEGRGWHLHLHALIDAHWIDAIGLSVAWNKANNGLGRIVKVKDGRDQDYLKEVVKYAVKGNQLAAWTGNQITEFLDAFSGVRTFGVFGSLYGARTEFAEWFKAIRDAKPRCTCGACDMAYYSEAEFLEKDFQPAATERDLPPPAPVHHPEFSNLLAVLPPR